MAQGSTETSARTRLAFIDNLRWTVIVMVVLTHACVTYSGVGSWYYVEKATVSPVQYLVFLFYQSFAQAFFMGILFFSAALFVPGAYDRRGFGRFLRDRLIRLGVPTLVYMLVLDPLTSYILAQGTGHPFPPGSGLHLWLQYVGSGSFIGSSGPLWFALALLIFSAVYALARLVRDALAGGRPPAVRTLPAPRTLSAGAVGLMAVMAAGTFLVRIVQPIGTSVLNMQLCYFTQYVLLFCVGL